MTVTAKMTIQQYGNNIHYVFYNTIKKIKPLRVAEFKK
jgi:hypothetical protein